MAEKMPSWKYSGGEVWIADLPIAAGLWALDGAAWDGAIGWMYPGADSRAWTEALREHPQARVIRVTVTGSHVERVPTTLLQDWVDKSPEGQGRHYAAGEVAPMPRAMFHLRCCYEELSGESRVRRVWTEPEAREWLVRWHQQGNAFLVIGNVYNDRANKLRNMLRDKHGMGQHRTMPAV